ncbi:MAG: transposase [Enhygromyxa sp.]
MLESRLDSAFFNEKVLELLEELGVEYGVAVPFAHYPGLKHRVHSRERWRRIDDEWSFFELDWRPKKWSAERRLICIRRRRAGRRKGPLQLDLFEPVDPDFEFKVIVTNKSTQAENVLHFFNGRGLNEAVFGEAKQFVALDYIPCRRRVANEIFTLSTMLAHNLGRELQMQVAEPTRATTPTRAPHYELKTLGTLRHLLLRQAGRLTRPQGRLCLSTAASGVARREFETIYQTLVA